MSYTEYFNVASTVAAGILGGAVTVYFSTQSLRTARKQLESAQRQNEHFEAQLRDGRTQMYLDLEMASIALFRFEAEHLDIVARFQEDEAQDFNQISTEHSAGLTSYVTQTLNLMELAVAFRKVDTFPADVFATWVAWMYETCASPTFQLNWSDRFRKHYSEELAEILDMGIDLLEPGAKLTEKESAKAFYTHAASLFDNCKYILAWADR